MITEANQPRHFYNLNFMPYYTTSFYIIHVIKQLNNQATNYKQI